MKHQKFRILLCLCLAAALLLSSLVGCGEKKPPEEPGEAVTPIGERDLSIDYVYDDTPHYKFIAKVDYCAKDYDRSYYICEYDHYLVKINQPLPKPYNIGSTIEITYKITDLSISEDGLCYVLTETTSVCTPIIDPPSGEITYDKPVIYLYPEVATTVDVRVNFKGEFTVIIPKYRDGWTVTAHPDGTLIDADGEEYPYLFWEGIPASDVLTLTEGFCVRGEDTETFLLDVLPRLGLIAPEYTEFIDFWLPRMEGNAYNVIRFNDPAYMDMAGMDIAPAPDTVIRVFMSYTASDVYVDLPAQHFTPLTRDGFTVVEWGGCEI
ncbi:MAG: hypothetical protein IJY66_01630, partial [Clostridia bacterium]|nr:hypothetical protein [Clostridia bacterium]